MHTTIVNSSKNAKTRGPDGRFLKGAAIRPVDEMGWPARRMWKALGVPGHVRIRDGENPEARAYRRFPISSHKPGGW